MLTRSTSNIRVALVLLGAVAVTGLSGCAAPAGNASGSASQWLEARGFSARGSWNSAALHLRGSQMQSAQRLSQLMDRVSEVRLRPSQENPLGLTRLLEDGESCVMGVYLNGVRLAPRGPDAQVDLDGRVGVRSLDGLELHLGAEGPVYDAEGCGSLLLWDRGMPHVEDPEFLGSIQGRVEGQGAQGDLVVTLVDGGSVPSEGRTTRVGANGSFVFLGLLPGEYRLEFSVEGNVVAHHTARVYANYVSRVRAEVTRGAVF